MNSHLVSFVSSETGDDLILSFAIPVSYAPGDIQSLILMRTPKYEGLLPDSERGIRCSMEGADDPDDYVRRVAYDRDASMVKIETTLTSYDLNVRKVDEEELEDMRHLLRRMNIDQKMELVGI